MRNSLLIMVTEHDPLQQTNIAPIPGESLVGGETECAFLHCSEYANVTNEACRAKRHLAVSRPLQVNYQGAQLLCHSPLVGTAVPTAIRRQFDVCD